MPIEATPIVTSPIELPCYLTVEQADGYAQQLHGVQAYVDASGPDKARALVTASQRLDASRRWQGRKADAEQALEFPRVDGDCSALRQATPVVPLNVRLAVVFEAASLLSGERQRILEAQQSGLQSQQIGSGSESYFAPTSARGVPLLCVEADARINQYRLRSGRLL